LRSVSEYVPEREGVRPFKKNGAVSSTDLKAWEDISDKISFPAGARHGTVFEADEEILGRLLNIK
jgi:hypothetical protein